LSSLADKMKLVVLAVTLGSSSVVAKDNGLGLTPPMGWRSWNLFGADVTQELIQGIMLGMTSRARTVDGVPTSLCDLGYCDVGLDDNWQQCGSYGADEFTYHSEDTGYPVINTDRFPDMKAMTDYAHSLNLTAGWYGNNCICKDHCGSGKQHNEDQGGACYQGDVDSLVSFGFDGVKLDNCGDQKDLQLWSDLITATGRPVMIENCHWGFTVPHRVVTNATADDEIWCPWNFFRTSQDVRASYSSVLFKLATTVPFAERGLSFPGCWAYPDGLEVGCAHGPGGDNDPGLSAEETRSHFGSWCIVSSPLTLSHDVNNDTITDAIWPVIANPEAIAINQAWAGHSGSPFKRAADTVTLPPIYKPSSSSSSPSSPRLMAGRNARGEQGVEEETAASFLPVKAHAWQYLSKPLSYESPAVAVLLMNQASTPQSLTLNFADVPGFLPTPTDDGSPAPAVAVRDVWARSGLGTFAGGVFATPLLQAHDAAFLVLTLA